ncbi:oxepin-CoA hydrolase, alternative type [Rouxiella sp. Mn2063]|uniref:oxepin-CoA hydrolase, alternative type n=1 Tax=Rouxiella sp. Mn2063 TaxID=3395262 RepID=UPI003BE2D2FB
MSDILLTRREGAVLVLTINNPSARNAMSFEFFPALTAALAQAQTDPHIGAIVLMGADNFFCSGGDLRRLAHSHEFTLQQRRTGIETLHQMIRALRDCSKPVIAAVEGGAAGAGVSLALACDLLVIADNAYFSVAYVKVGLTPDGGVTGFLADAMPRQLATELCLTGERIFAPRLAQLGIANRLAEAGQVEMQAMTLAAWLAQGPGRAMGRIKKLCRAGSGNTLMQQLDLEAQCMVESQGDSEAREGISAFLEKRPADFVALRGAARGGHQ